MGRPHLILDVDETLLHAMMRADVGAGAMGSAEDAHYLTAADMWLKVRPGVRIMLDVLSRLYVLHIFSAGSQQHVANACAVLEPQSRLITGKRLHAGNLTNGLKCVTDDAVSPDDALILDDSIDMWCERWQPVVVEAKRYVYFKPGGGVAEESDMYVRRLTSFLALVAHRYGEGLPMQLALEVAYAEWFPIVVVSPSEMTMLQNTAPLLVHRMHVRSGRKHTHRNVLARLIDAYLLLQPAILSNNSRPARPPIAPRR